MTKREFLQHCFNTYGTEADYPFEEDFETAVLRHKDNRKWYAIVMNISRRKLGLNSDEKTYAVNVKLPFVLMGAYDPEDGVYPAYHMNKNHWVSVLLTDASEELIKYLVNVSFDMTCRPPKKNVKR